ncbi:MAG: hypothetical protein AAF570_14005, partial [Bacteroidota bacterium]
SSQAQNAVHAGVGLNVSYTAADSLNAVFDRFNAENDYDQPMPNIHVPMGIHATVGANLGGLLLDFSYTMRMAGARASDINAGGQEFTNQVRYSANTIDIGLGYFFVNTPTFRLAPGISMDLGRYRLRYRGGLSSNVAIQPWGSSVNELNMGLTGFVQIMIPFSEGIAPGLFIRPYYQLGVVQNDQGPINRVLRPQTAADEEFFILDNASNFGIKIGVVMFSN